jgi:hypothetical protein
MQNKTAIWLFIIFLTAASIYQLSFTRVTNSVENDSEAYASEKLDSLLEISPEMSSYAQDSAFSTIESNYLLVATDELLVHTDVERQQCAHLHVMPGQLLRRGPGEPRLRLLWLRVWPPINA